MSRNLILGAVSAASVVSFVTIPLSGHISDRIGRKKMYMIGGSDHGRIRLPLFRHDRHRGEAFTPRLRYSGASLGISWHRSSQPAQRR